MKREKLNPKISIVSAVANCSLKKWFQQCGSGKVPWKRAAERVILPFFARFSRCIRSAFVESSCLGMQLKIGGKFHPKLNMCVRPIANKYREGKMKRTLKRELNST